MASGLRILSLGAGVQSSTLLLMALHGEIHADAAIFADTGWEPARVYEHLWRLGEACAMQGFPLYVVDNGSLRDALLSPGRFASLPFHLAGPRGRGMARRQCTNEHKIVPIRRATRSLLAQRGEKRATMLMGISLDEVARMRDSDVRYITNEYPLIDMGWRRNQCEDYLRAHGWEAPRSSCVGCPFHSTREWLALTPDEVADAALIEATVQRNTKLDMTPWLHEQRRPIGEAVAGMRDMDGRSPRLWDDECSGVCGV